MGMNYMNGTPVKGRVKRDKLKVERKKDRGEKQVIERGV